MPDNEINASPQMTLEEAKEAIEQVAATLYKVARETGIRFELDAFDGESSITCLSISPTTSYTQRIAEHMKTVFAETSYQATFDNAPAFYKGGKPGGKS